MSSGMKGLTGSSLIFKILLGRKPTFSLTKGYTDKRQKYIAPQFKVIFSGAFNESNVNSLQFATWLPYCLAYGKTAEVLKDSDKGDLVLIHCWQITEAEKNELNQPVVKDGEYQTVNKYICDDIVLLDPKDPIGNEQKVIKLYSKIIAIANGELKTAVFNSSSQLGLGDIQESPVGQPSS